jgi:hypothetical protein
MQPAAPTLWRTRRDAASSTCNDRPPPGFRHCRLRRASGCLRLVAQNSGLVRPGFWKGQITGSQHPSLAIEKWRSLAQGFREASPISARTSSFCFATRPSIDRTRRRSPRPTSPEEATAPTEAGRSVLRHSCDDRRNGLDHPPPCATDRLMTSSGFDAPCLRTGPNSCPVTLLMRGPRLARSSAPSARIPKGATSSPHIESALTEQNEINEAPAKSRSDRPNHRIKAVVGRLNMH